MGEPPPLLPGFSMYEGHTVGVVVPAYNEADNVAQVIEGIPSYVDRVYVVDDGSTDDTWMEIERTVTNGGDSYQGGFASERDHVGPTENEQSLEIVTGTAISRRRVVPIRHEENRGVGGAIKTGYRAAYRDGIDVVAVIAGDDQMDPAMLASLLDPIVEGQADYAKGNRLLYPETRRGVPRFRLVGNVILSVLTKIASGYWTISDSQNGYTAISRQALESVAFEEMYEFYGYCNDLLVKLNASDQVVVDVPASITYGDETSHISYRSYIPRVSVMLLLNFLWRLKEKYVVRDFHPLVLLYGLGAVGAGITIKRILEGLRSRTRGDRADGDGEASSPVSIGFLSVLALVFAMIEDRRHNEHLDEQRHDRPRH